MRAVIVLCVMLLASAPAAAQQAAPATDAEGLRRELEQMRQQFERVQGEYRKAMETMSERLQRLEARPQSAATQPVAPAPALVQAPAAPAPSQPTLMDIVRPRPPFSLTERTGRGQLLFDMGVVGDFIGNLTGGKVDRADVGTFAGRENRILPREIELMFFGQIDPFARGEVRIEAAEEFEGGARATAVNLAEANLTLLTLPWGFQTKMGKMRNRFGLLNERHREALPQPDQPNVLTNFIGEEGLNESGIEVTWVAPLPVYLELLGGVSNGDNDVAFGRGSLRHPLLTGRARTFFELGPLSAVQLGASVASGQTADPRHNDNALWGIDAKYKLIPEGWRHPLLTLGSEALWGSRQTTVPADLDGDGIDETSLRRTRDRFGWYVYGEVQPWKQWLGGLRYDWSQYPVNAGDEWAIEPYVAFMPSDFLRFRLGYKHTERDRSEFFQANGGNGRVANEIFLQATFFLGAHPAHPF